MEKISIEFFNLIENLFKDNKINLNKIICKGKLYYNGKQVLEYLEYSNDRSHFARGFNKLKEEYKTTLDCLYEEFPISSEDPNSEYVNSLDGNQRKNTLLTEEGANFLIFKSDKPKALKFKEFLVEKLFPALRNYGLKQLEKSKEKVSTLEEKLDKILDTNTRLEQSNQELKEQNKQLLELANKQDIKLDNINKELSETSFNLDKLTDVVVNNVLPDRNLKPKNSRLQHEVALYKNFNQEYVFLRAQNYYISKMLKDVPKEDIVFKTSYPNPIDLLSKLKERSEIANQEIKEKIIRHLNKEKYSSYKEQLKSANLRLFDKNKKFMIVNNKLELNHSTLDEFVRIYNEIIQEQNTLDV